MKPLVPVFKFFHVFILKKTLRILPNFEMDNFAD